ncbi:MAG TPA: dolichyl-phosphate beta-glucosyltransferase [Candidatus Limnocylindrales bacterium]|jgi:dolichyl-phosphate beta-glucosyltransferase
MRITKETASPPHLPAPALSLVIPAYNEALRLPPTLARIREYLDSQPDGYEVLVVDDGSGDDTVAVAEAVASEWPQLQVLRLPENRGKGAAVREGMLHARGALRAFSDADLSTPIEELPRLRSRLGGACQVAIASRDLPGSDIQLHQPAWREFMGRTYNRILRLLVLPGIRDTQCGFKLFTAEAAEALFTPLETFRFGFDAEVLVRAHRRGWEIAEVPVQWRHVEESRVGGIGDALRMLYDLVRLRFRRL